MLIFHFLLLNYADVFIGVQSLRKPLHCFLFAKNISLWVPGAAAAAGTQIWCPDLPYCSHLPSSAALLHRAGPHNAQMVAIVLLPCPLPPSVEQEAFLCMPEGQEAWLTTVEPIQKHKSKHKDTSITCLHIFHVVKQTTFLCHVSQNTGHFPSAYCRCGFYFFTFYTCSLAFEVIQGYTD